MNSKQRVIDILNHKIPDRIAVFDSFWDEFIENWRNAAPSRNGTDIYDYYDIDISIVVADETFFPSQKGVLKKEGGYSLYNDGWGRTVKMRDNSYFSQTVGSVLENKSRLDSLQFEPAGLPQRYTAFDKAVAREKEKRCVFCKIGGPFIRSTFIRGEAEFLMDLAADPEFAADLVHRVGEHLLAVGLESLRRGNVYDTGIWIFDDMGANCAPMFSPAAFENIFLPVYKKIVPALKKAGAAKVILHSDGNIAPLLDMLAEAGIDGINPVEPKAGMDIVALKKQYGNRLAFIGGVDNAGILPAGDTERITAHLMPILECAKEGGVIVGSHSVGPDISISSYEYYRNLVRRHGNFSAGNHL